MKQNILNFLKKNSQKSTLKNYTSRVDKINKLEAEFEAFSDEDLKQKTVDFRARLVAGETLEALLPEAFATVREAAKRVLSMRHYDVQLIGGMVINEVGIAEMRTGEGKTLMATLPIYLNALEGKGAHLVTVNDYLARRDAVWMGQLYEFLGMTTGIINSGESFMYDGSNYPQDGEVDLERDEEASYKVAPEFLRSVERHEAYACDITYGTNSEFGFDYLRDNLEYSADSLRQKQHAFAIVDEIDSILIDEARTPLIISSAAAESESYYEKFASIVTSFKEGEDYEVDEKKRQTSITEAGVEKVEKALGIDNIYTEGGRRLVHHMEVAVQARALFKRDEKYVVQGGQIVIVDEFTGRMQAGRRFSMGIHQAIEAKEGVPIQRESQTVASITYQNFFRMYKKLSGMTGTAETSTEEFYKVYGLEVKVIPTNQPIARIDRNDLIYKSEQGKFKAIASKVKELQEKGQPVLIGTVSVEKNEMLSQYLSTKGVKHEILNAKNHAREGEIVASAGVKGAVTVATNMAGRGVDIKLGGPDATKEQQEEVKALGGLYVIGTERHEARRIDNQLRGRCGRQGDPGETQFFVSLDDPLMRVFANDALKRVMQGFDDEESIQHRFITNSLETAQTKIEGFHFDSRKSVLQYDDVLSTQRKAVYSKRLSMLTGSPLDVEAMIYLLSDDDEKIKEQSEKYKQELGEKTYIDLVKRFYLQTIDRLWMDHLGEMDYLRSSVNLRAYGQLDPLVEYKKEGLRLYRELELDLKDKVLGMIENLNPEAVRTQAAEVEARIKKAEENFEKSQAKDSGKSSTVSSDLPKIGRNDIVTIVDPATGVEERMKYKKAERKILHGWELKA